MDGSKTRKNQKHQRGEMWVKLNNYGLFKIKIMNTKQKRKEGNDNCHERTERF